MTHHSAGAVREEFELRFCFLCDADAPHLSTEIDGEYVFQCRACFASHVEPLPTELRAAGHGRHRAA